MIAPARLPPSTHPDHRAGLDSAAPARVLRPVGLVWLDGSGPSRGASAPTELRYPSGSLVLVGGLPGAGKTTLLERVALPDHAAVLDTEMLRSRWARWLGRRVASRRLAPIVHIEHGLKVAGRLLRDSGPVVVHLRATRSLQRRLLARVARLRGRECHLIFLHVPPAVADLSQRRRGRRVRSGVLEREWADASRLLARLRAAEPPANPLREEGYASCVVLDRPAASSLRAITFG